jgi:hypothetical protein
MAACEGCHSLAEARSLQDRRQPLPSRYVRVARDTTRIALSSGMRFIFIYRGLRRIRRRCYLEATHVCEVP